MKSLIIVSLMAASGLAINVPAQEYTFEAYARDFGKTYASAEERARREKVFSANLRAIAAHNAMAGRSYDKGINQFTDMTSEEFKGRMLGYKKSLGRQLNKDIKIVDMPKGVKLEDSIDYRTHNPPVLTAVKNQGACGSCWAHAAVETMESFYAVRTGKLMNLSVEQVTQCTENPKECGGTGKCEGATAALGYMYAVKSGGLVRNEDYPYTAADSTCNVTGSPVAAFRMAVRLRENDQVSVKTALTMFGPVSISVDASVWGSYAGGVFDGCSYDANIDLNHAVQLVGYGSEGGKDYWIVRNSWGTGWGEQGYIRLAREAEPKCGKDSTPKDGSGCKDDPDTPIEVCGQCGVLYDVGYATVA